MSCLPSVVFLPFLLIFLVFLSLYAELSSTLVFVTTGMAIFDGGRCWSCLIAALM